MRQDGGTDDVAARSISFIYDEPAEEDRFKTHSRLAAAIATAITSNPRLRVIGLLGRWGSGKSTVIRHLGKTLSAPPAPRIFFTYDAWLHQGSPIRRSFLESLLEFLVARQLPDAASLQVELDQLTGKRVVEDKFTAPVLTKDAAFLLLSLLGWPIALSLLKLETLKDYFGNATSDGARIAFYAAIVLLLFPLLLALIFWGIRHKRGAFDQPATGILPALLNKTIETKRETTLKLPDPTPTQFADLFRKIMKRATGTGSKYVLVIDNLDRLPETEAMQVWAAVRSFFVDTHDPTHTWQPVVIIPVDRVAIEEMFRLTHGDKGRSAHELASSFIAKSFDITFEVTEPVMSDWRDFLRDKLTLVFGELATEDARYWIVSLFDAYTKAKSLKITPREINNLVNRVATLYMQWGEEGIRLPIIAFYAMHAREIEEDVVGFVTDADRAFLSRIHPEWKVHIAAMHFGVEVSKAAQVLLEERLINAIRSGGPDDVSGLTNVPGFYEEFGSLAPKLALLATEANTSGFEITSNYSAILGALADASETWLGEIGRAVTAQFLTISPSDRMPEDLDKRLAALAAIAPPDLADGYLVSAAAWVSTALQSSTAISAGHVAAATNLYEFARNRGLTLEIDLSDDPGSLLRAFAKLREKGEVRRCLRSEASWDPLQDALAALLENPASHGLLPDLVSFFLGDGFDVVRGTPVRSWSKLIQAARAAIDDGEKDPAIHASAMRALGLLLPIAEGGHEMFLEMLSGPLPGHFHQWAATNRDAFIAATALMVWGERDIPPPPTSSWTAVIAADPALLNDVLTTMHLQIGENRMEQIWVSYDEIQTGRYLIRQLMEHGVRYELFSELDPVEVTKDLTRYLNPLPYQMQRKLVARLEGQGFWEELRSGDLKKLQKGAKLVATQGSDQADHASAIVEERLAAAPIDQWVEAVEKGGQLYALAVDPAFKQGGRFGAQSTLAAGLQSAAAKLVAGPHKDARKRWTKLFSLLNAEGGKTCLSGLGRELRKGSRPTVVLAVLKDAPAGFLKHGGFTENADEVVPFIATLAKMAAGREWLKSHSKEIHGWLASLSTESRGVLDMQLAAWASSKDEGKRYWAEVVGDTWRLKKRE